MARHEPYEEGPQKGVRLLNWDVSTVKQPISNAEEIQKAEERIKVPLPEICFGNNSLQLRHEPSGFDYVFDAFGALDLVAADASEPGAGSFKVAHAAEWQKTRTASLDNVQIVRNNDWTYTTTYSGTLEAGPSFVQAPANHPGIPLAKLASQREPIIFFDEVTLFEDELHDCGIASLIVRVRVMPSCVFVLSRFFLRADGVLFRVYDTRLYHEFGSGNVIKETRGRENAYDTIKKMLPADNPMDLTPLSDPVWVANAIGMLEDLPQTLAYTEIEGEPLAGQRASTKTLTDWSGIGTRLEICHLGPLRR